MPYYYHNEVWTPFKYVGIRLFIDENGNKWIKIWNKHRRPFFKQSNASPFEEQ
ncbi:hypothetical protein [Paenibacillus sp. Soil787]|uniref:hypothetical protein n=1 Tax=Paenibacillus sp. Soil787 TaxID=1736411 RepID=UPI0012E3F689|nr:hypothetical protein [Paenibacillus sp. Soil787]